MTTLAEAAVDPSDSPEAGAQPDTGRRNAVALWAAFLPRLLARSVLFAALGMLFWAFLPTLFGWHATTVMSDSMAPRIWRGDIVVSVPVSGAPAVGRIALFDDPDHPGRLRMHRVVAVSGDGTLTTKGDANAADDSTPVAAAAVRGVAVLRVPWLGFPIVWLRDRELVQLAVFGVAAAAVLALALPTGATSGHGRRCGGGPRSGGPAAGHPALMVAAVVAAGSTVAFALAAPAPAHASFNAVSAAPASTFSAASSFSCAAPTLPAPAYLYYRFAETTGSQAADSSGNARTGVLSGGITHLGGSCGAGQAPALGFDGSSGALVSPYVGVAPSTYSLALWFTTTSTTGGMLIGFGNAASGASTVYDRHVYLSADGRLYFGVYPLLSPVVISSPASYNDGGWHQVVATQSSSGMRLYVDGVRVAMDATTKAAEPNVGYWRIGYDAVAGWPGAPTSAHFSGAVSDVAVYGSVLNATQVAASFAAGR
ncbi:MAG: LamG domain-containing protein [Microbacteriaceae bacterium]|nr:LamG domain-containing protein [Microbacteriaceae bacterium]MCL2795561.1 LamG domain-containing protein [Microbacteriaceae bacterium]